MISGTILRFMSRSPGSASVVESAQEEAPAALTERLGYLLKHAYHRYQASQGPALEPLELDGRLLAVLTLLDAEGPALQQRLSERLQVDRTTMVALVDALEDRGFVTRQRDPADRRGQRVGATTKGATALERGQ